MKLQFSLATLLVCVTVLAVVCADAIEMPVLVERQSSSYVGGITLPSSFKRPPDDIDIAWRMALWGPSSVAATLGVLWSIRRLKSRRHTEPPVGSTALPLPSTKPPR